VSNLLVDTVFYEAVLVLVASDTWCWHE